MTAAAVAAAARLYSDLLTAGKMRRVVRGKCQSCIIAVGCIVSAAIFAYQLLFVVTDPGFSLAGGSSAPTPNATVDNKGPSISRRRHSRPPQVRDMLENVAKDVTALHAMLQQKGVKIGEEASGMAQQLSLLRGDVEILRLQMEVQDGRVAHFQRTLDSALALLQQQEQRQEQRERRRRGEFVTGFVTDDLPSKWQQRTFQPYGAYGFVRFSAYRVSRTRVAVLGLAALAQREGRRFTNCSWHGGGGEGGGPKFRIPGRLEMMYMGEHHSYVYEVVVLNCHLEQPLSESGGYLEVVMDQQVMYLYREEAHEPLDEPTEPFKHQLLYCGAPMHGDMEPRAILEWVHYHRLYAGVDHFLFYDAGGFGDEVRQAVRPYSEAGMLTATDYVGVGEWDAWFWAQGLAIHDCAYRSHYTARWVFMQDLDEYLEVAQPVAATIHDLLKEHENAPWISHGCLVFGVDKCTKHRFAPEKSGGDGGDEGGAVGVEADPDDAVSDGRLRGVEGRKKRHGTLSEASNGTFLMEQMVYRWPHIYCQDPSVADPRMCVDQVGHRKYIVNPRKVDVLQIHIITRSEPGGVDLSTDVLRHVHYRGLAMKNFARCSEFDPKDWWGRYDGAAQKARAVRRCVARGLLGLHRETVKAAAPSDGRNSSAAPSQLLAWEFAGCVPGKLRWFTDKSHTGTDTQKTSSIGSNSSSSSSGGGGSSSSSGGGGVGSGGSSIGGSDGSGDGFILGGDRGGDNSSSLTAMTTISSSNNSSAP